MPSKVTLQKTLSQNHGNFTFQNTFSCKTPENYFENIFKETHNSTLKKKNPIDFSSSKYFSLKKPLNFSHKNDFYDYGNFP